MSKYTPVASDNVVNLRFDLGEVPDFPSEMRAVVTVESGQRLLPAFKHPLNLDQMHRLYDYLGERLPGLEFAVGCDELAMTYGVEVPERP